MGCSRREAMGTVASLWGESQEQLRTSGSMEEIVDWADIFMLKPAEIDRWIQALVRAGFLIRHDDGSFDIRGNKTQIETRVSNMARAAKGAEATRKKWEKINQAKSLPVEGSKQGLKPGPEHAASPEPSTLGPGPTNAMQFNAMQSNAEEVEAQAPAAEFPIIPELQGDEILAQILGRISDSAQKVWLRRAGGNAEKLKIVLLDAVAHRLEGGLSIEQIDDWGSHLGKWVRRERSFNGGLLPSAQNAFSATVELPDYSGDFLDRDSGAPEEGGAA